MLARKHLIERYVNVSECVVKLQCRLDTATVHISPFIRNKGCVPNNGCGWCDHIGKRTQ